MIPGIREAYQKEHGREPTNAELAKELGINEDFMPGVFEFMENGFENGGWRVFDISDRTKPKEISYTKTFGLGTHRFHVDENYSYISSEMEGYVGNILIVYDMKDPTKPEEVTRWWIPGQHVAGGEKPTWEGLRAPSPSCDAGRQ